jgi:amino acid permease
MMALEFSPAVADTVVEAQFLAPPIVQNDWLFVTVYGLVVVWLVFMCIVFGILLKKFTFGNWTPENPNPYQGETFGMPRGVFRGFITLSLVFIVMLLEIVNLVTEGLEGKIDQLLVAFQMMLAFYFGSKVMHHVTSADERKNTQAQEETKAVEDDKGAVG